MILLSGASAAAQPTLKTELPLDPKQAVQEVLRGPELTPVIVRDSLGSRDLARLTAAAQVFLLGEDLGPNQRPWGLDILAWLRGEWAAPARVLQMLTLLKGLDPPRYRFR